MGKHKEVLQGVVAKINGIMNKFAANNGALQIAVKAAADIVRQE